MIPVFDGHNDILFRILQAPENREAIWLTGEGKGHLDLPRMAQGGFVGGFFAIYIPSPPQEDEDGIDYHQLIENPPYRLPLPALISAEGLATAPAGSPAGSRDTGNLAALLAALGAETGPAAGTDVLLLGLSSRVAALDSRREGLGVVAASAEAELLRETGVDLDTEAANLVRLQQAFEANSRVIQVATELFDTLLGLR